MKIAAEPHPEIRRFSPSLLVFSLIAFICPGVFAQTVTSCQTPGTCPAQTVNFTPVVSPFLASVFPMTPLRAGLKEFSVAPGAFTASESKDAGQTSDRGFNVHGAGASASFVYGFSSHFGVSVIASVESSKGTAPLIIQYGANNSYVSEFDGSIEQQAAVTMASLIFDPFSNPDGFRMPIFLGYGIYHSDDKRTGTAIVGGNTIQAQTTVVSDGASVALGLAPSLKTWKLRWTLFALGMNGGTDKKSSSFTNVTTHGGLDTGNSDSSDFVMTAGLSVNYIPWNIGFVYTPSIAWDKNGKESLYSLKWSHQFGKKPDSQ
jgi:hypothetical protein